MVLLRAARVMADSLIAEALKDAGDEVSTSI